MRAATQRRASRQSQTPPMHADLRNILNYARRRLAPKSEMALGKNQITFPYSRRARSSDIPRSVIARVTARSAASRSASGSLIRSINQSAV